ncbi:hypothetical protein FG91_04054 [Sphingopyxis sp. LC81]|nr:hypothetical protein FG91_04054 [Sphingopyxis sp. LC81]
MIVTIQRRLARTCVRVAPGAMVRDPVSMLPDCP